MNFDDVFDCFSNKIDEEIAWRKKELANIKNLITDEDNEKARFFRRSAIALSYAHLEGGVKSLFIIYVKFLNKLFEENVLTFEKIDDILFDLVFYDKRNIIIQNDRAKRLKVFEECRKIFLNKKLKINKKIVDTKSNLSFDVLKDIYELFDVRMNKDITIEEKFIDTLKDRRNYIAHGENKDHGKDEVIDSIKKVIKILDLVKYDILEKMSNHAVK